MVAWIRVLDRNTRPATWRQGFTLLEVLVVLILLGIGFALAVPAFITPRAGSNNEVQRVIDGARRVAVRRAEALTVWFDASGNWVVDTGRRDTEPLTGNVEWEHSSAIRLRISPLGACVLDSVEPSLSIDVVRCRLQRRGQS